MNRSQLARIEAFGKLFLILFPLLFFYMIVFPTDSFFNWLTTNRHQREEEMEEEKRKEDEKKFAKGFDLSKLAPIHRRKDNNDFKRTYRSWICFLWGCWTGTGNCRETVATDY